MDPLKTFKELYQGHFRRCMVERTDSFIRFYGGHMVEGAPAVTDENADEIYKQLFHSGKALDESGRYWFWSVPTTSE